MSVIEQGLAVIGDLVGEDRLIVKGTVKGSVFLQKGEVSVEPTGYIEGEIVAQNVMFAGEILGNITALTRLQVTPSAKVIGNLQAAQIVIEDGAKFSGKMEIREPDPVELGIEDFKALSEEDYRKLQQWRIRNKLQ